MTNSPTKDLLLSEKRDLEMQIHYIDGQLKKVSRLEELENSREGSKLEDGSVVVVRQDNYFIIAAPSDTEVVCSWGQVSHKYGDNFASRGFRKEDWFVPDLPLLKMAYDTAREEFSLASYWTTDEVDCDTAWAFHAHGGGPFIGGKSATSRVRTFQAIFI